MERVLEPEVMDDEAGAAAYAGADFAESNRRYVDRLIEVHGNGLGRVLDLGCGPADVPIRIARRMPTVHVTAVDASGPMVRLARRAVTTAGLAAQVDVVGARLPDVPFTPGAYGAILSKDMLHHLPDPGVLWTTIRRLGVEDTAVFVADLVRPASRDEAASIVAAVSSEEPEVLRKDFYNSLMAALSLEEVHDQAAAAGLHLDLRPFGDRHWLATGRVGSGQL